MLACGRRVRDKQTLQNIEEIKLCFVAIFLRRYFMRLVYTLQTNFLDFRACGEFISEKDTKFVRSLHTKRKNFFAPTLFHFFACVEISFVRLVSTGL